LRVSVGAHLFFAFQSLVNRAGDELQGRAMPLAGKDGNFTAIRIVMQTVQHNLHNVGRELACGGIRTLRKKTQRISSTQEHRQARFHSTRPQTSIRAKHWAA
jgi:hypothetical protein